MGSVKLDQKNYFTIKKKQNMLHNQMVVFNLNTEQSKEDSETNP